jgi:hypothetical protein
VSYCSLLRFQLQSSFFPMARPFSLRRGLPALFVLDLFFMAEAHMRDVTKLRLLCSSFCEQYQSDAMFYIDEAQDSRIRNLVVVYEKGGYGGGKEFTASIPKAWTDDDVLNLIRWPMKDLNAPYPAWEVPARTFGSPVLARSSQI